MKGQAGAAHQGANQIEGLRCASHYKFRSVGKWKFGLQHVAVCLGANRIDLRQHFVDR